MSGQSTSPDMTSQAPASGADTHSQKNQPQDSEPATNASPNKENQGRVIKLDRGLPLIQLSDGTNVRCKHATALVKGEKVRAVIGDNVEVFTADDVDNAQIVRILPRRNVLVRKDPAERVAPQVMAANFDTVLIAHPIAELNIRRLERELVLAHETGAQVAIVLTKADLADDAQAAEAMHEVASIAGSNVQVLAISEHDIASIEQVRSLVPDEQVAVLIGRSGVGKSSLVNVLAGFEAMETTPVRETDGKGRHTTVSRAMVPVAGGGLIVDMPGIRGLGLWESEAGIQTAFSDVVELSMDCKFRDCKHEAEPGCAVRAAVAEGRLSEERLASYKRLSEELESTAKAFRRQK